MFVEFDNLPDTSRIWIYQSNRSFTEDEIQNISTELRNFLEKWTAHGSDLLASYKIEYKRFIIIGLNQNLNSASGCSIDASVHFIQSLEQRFNVDLLDKMNVSYKHGEHVAYKPLSDFKKMAKQGAVSPKTIVFNNLVATKGEFEENWEVPASESWHGRFL